MDFQKENRLCEWCGKGCFGPCEPLEYILKGYDRQRTQDKKELLKILRNELEIIDCEPSPEYAELGNKVIDKIEELAYIRDYDIKIGYLISYEAKTKDSQIVFADCRKVNSPYTGYLPYDFLITFYEPNMDLLFDNQKKVVMWHELRHAGIGPKGKKLQPHEITDFKSIAKSLGIDCYELGQEVPDILAGENIEKTSEKKKRKGKVS